MTEVIWAESFEHYGVGTTSTIRDRMTQGLWTSLSSLTGNGTISNGTARTGSIFYQMAANSSSMRRQIGSRSIVGVAFGLRFPSLPTDNGQWFQVRDSSNVSILSFIWKTDGSIDVRQGNTGGTLLASSEQVFSAGTWHHVELIARISETVGYIEVRVDGLVAIILTDLNLGTSVMAQVIWGTTTSQGIFTNYDDIVAHTGEDFIGPARVLCEFLEADGSPIDWDIVGTSTAFDALNESAPNDDTDYIQADEPDRIALFPMPELPADVTEIVGIHIPFRCKQIEAGLTKVRTSIISNGEITQGFEHPLTPAYNYREDAYNTDPGNSDTPWNKASFEAAFLQIERTV